MAFFGWSLCDTGKGDKFDPRTGIDIARKRALKLGNKQNSDFVLNYSTDNQMTWKIYGPMATLPDSMADSLGNATRRAFRIIDSIERREAESESEYGNFVTKIREQYPAIYGKTCSISVNSGWYPLVEKGFSITQKYRNMGIELEVIQVKEKFGGLRFYTSAVYNETEGNPNLMEKFYGEIRELEAEAAKTCEVCGVNGPDCGVENRDINGWFTTICEKCQKSKT
jgi:hypothetical protein